MLLNLWSYSYLLQKTISLTELPFSFSVYSLLKIHRPQNQNQW